MGNSATKNKKHPESSTRIPIQLSAPNLFGSFSGRSVRSVCTVTSSQSVSAPFSRSTKLRHSDSNRSLRSSKTNWPLARSEVLFLPDFPLKSNTSTTDFIVHESIAKGAYGQVYRANKEGIDYALKVLAKSQVVRDSAIRQVKQEAKIQELCGHHQFIVGSVTRWQTKGNLYIVSEYIPGGELLSLLNKYKKLPEEIVKVYLAELALAIDFLHNAGVVYRDLKPENILVDGAAHLKLVDFGLSKWLSIGQRTHTLCGTAKYMAPEVFTGEGYGHAVDWWSLGVVVCRMLTNQYPTSAQQNSSEESTAGSRPGTLPRGVELTDSSRKLLWRLLDPEWRRRLRTTRELQQTAFYMGFDWEQIRSMKVSPKALFAKYFPTTSESSYDDDDDEEYTNQLRVAGSVFSDFDNVAIV